MHFPVQQEIVVRSPIEQTVERRSRVARQSHQDHWWCQVL